MSSYHISIFIVAMILVRGHISLGQTATDQPPGTVKVISAGRCFDDREINEENDNGPSCRSEREYWKCQARFYIANNGTDSISVEELQSTINLETASLGLSCNINAQTVVNEILQEQRDGIVWDTVNTSPLGFDNATTLGGCLDTRDTEVARNGDLNCEIARQYTKCEFRVVELHRSQVTQEELQRLENELEANLEKEGLICDLQVHGIYQDLRKGLTVTVISVGRCFDDQEINEENDNGPSCRSVREYWKCRARLDIANRGAEAISINGLQSVLDSEAAKLGRPCNINALRVVDEILQEQRDGIVWDTVNIAPPGFDNATTLGGCFDTRNFEISQNGDLNCAIIRQYIKCRFRVLELHKAQATHEELQQLENQLEADVEDLGLICDLQVHGMFQELRREFDDAKNVQECTAALVDQQTQFPNSVCDTAQGYLECVVRVSNLQGSLSRQQIRDLVQQVQTSLRRNGIECDLDESKVLPGDNSGSRNHSPELILLLASLVLSLLGFKLF